MKTLFAGMAAMGIAGGMALSAMAADAYIDSDGTQSIVLDYYINTTRQSVQLFIISHNKHQEIAEFITQQGHRGVTVLNAMGWYSKTEHDVLFVLARKRESSYLRSGIKQIDPEAFVSMAYVKGVYGNGFDLIKAKEKKTPKQ